MVWLRHDAGASPPAPRRTRAPTTRLPLAVALASLSLVLPPAAATAQEPTSSGTGVCASATEQDPAGDVDRLDVVSVAASYDCESDVWSLVLTTSHSWTPTKDDVFLAVLDTDRSTGTGCEGHDYRIEAGELWHTPSCTTPWSVVTGDGTAPTAGTRVDAQARTITLWAHGAHLGSPASLSYGGVTASSPQSYDRFPDATGGSFTVGRAPTARGTAQACPGEVRDAGFTDLAVSDAPHGGPVHCMAHWEVARGVRAGVYAPASPVSRAQMAAFVARLLDRSGAGLPAASQDHFADDDASPHKDSIDRLAEAGIVAGTGAGRYSPGADVSRAQMAAFLTRAYDYRARQAGQPALTAGADWFHDDDGAVLEPEINLAAEAGLAAGRPDGSYGPAVAVRRDQMGSFLARTLDLVVANGMAEVPPAVQGG